MTKMQHKNNLQFLATIKGLIIDADGVLWRGETASPGLIDFFQFLRQHHIRFMLATNNSRKTPEQYKQKLARFGVDIAHTEIMTSAIATAKYLKSTYPPNTKIFVIGQDGLYHAIQSVEFEIVKENAHVVVVGLDFELTYDKLKKATNLIYYGADFVGTNPDTSFPIEMGIAPGNGAALAAISAATGKQPIIIGKPKSPIFQLALQEMNLLPKQTAMIGDRLNTDILGGQNACLKTILVLSGVTSRDDWLASDVKPDIVFDSIAEFIDQWQSTLSA